MDALEAGPTLPPELVERVESRLATGEIELPALPDSANRVLHACLQEDVDLRRVEKIVEGDPLLAGQLLKVANSALYAPPSPVATIRQALTLLGISRLREIALWIACESRAFRVKGFEAEAERLLEEAKATAGIAVEAARRAGLEVDVAFIGGLLHDIGRPVLLQELVDQRAILRVKLRRPLPLPLEGARAFLDEHHAELGGRLLEAWHLPEVYVEIARHHHDPARAGEETRRHVAAVRVAHDLARGIADEGTRAAAEVAGLPPGAADEMAADGPEIVARNVPF